MPTDGTDSGERERIIAAAHDELTRWGIDRFSVAAMAERHGIDPDSVWRYWDDEESVVLEALLDAPSRAIALPDTGALCDDLAQLASEMAAYLMTDEGRRLLRAHVITNDDSSRISVRRDAWSLRAHALHDIFDRARLRVRSPATSRSGWRSNCFSPRSTCGYWSPARRWTTRTAPTWRNGFVAQRLPRELRFRRVTGAADRARPCSSSVRCSTRTPCAPTSSVCPTDTRPDGGSRRDPVLPAGRAMRRRERGPR